jgi:hypothetical protein
MIFDYVNRKSVEQLSGNNMTNNFDPHEQERVRGSNNQSINQTTNKPFKQ